MATTKKTVAPSEGVATPPKTTTKKIVEKGVDAPVAAEVKAPKVAKAPAVKKTPVTKTASQETLHTVEFVKFSPDSKVVEIAGTFNAWKPAKLKKDKEGNWKIKLDLPAGQHQYKFVFEGTTWEHDDTVDKVPDGQGGFNNLKTL